MTRILRPITALSLAILAVMAGGGNNVGIPGIAPVAAENALRSQVPLSLEQRRRIARERKITRATSYCRTVSRELSALKARPCATGDRLDPRTNVCHPAKNIWMPYVRWDPAAGRCKSRDTFDGVSCVGAKQRYKPGRRFAQSLASSAGMYGHATAQLEGALGKCRRAVSGLKSRASSDREKNARICAKAQKLGRADLVQLYCR